MGRNKKEASERKTKIIRFLVTEQEFDIYNSRKNRLSKHSPTLTSSEIFRSVAKSIDDKALIMILIMDINNPIRTKLVMDFDRLFNKQDN